MPDLPKDPSNDHMVRWVVVHGRNGDWVQSAGQCRHLPFQFDGRRRGEQSTSRTGHRDRVGWFLVGSTRGG
jgi:hypothetical protein